MRFDMRPAEFWESDPRETVRFIRARVWSISNAHKQALAVAWHTAALHRAERMPPLAEVLKHSTGRRRRKQFATPDQEWAMWQALATAINAQHDARVKAGLA